MHIFVVILQTDNIPTSTIIWEIVKIKLAVKELVTS
jgi:hypothetical protein